MARPAETDIAKHVNHENMNRIAERYESKLQSHAKSLADIQEDIPSARMRYKGYSAEEAASAVNMIIRSYNIQKLWNRGETEAPIPNFGADTVRLRYPDKPRQVKNTDRMKADAAEFCAVNRTQVIEFSERSKIGTYLYSIAFR
ncbi:MAG: hypothetical protein LBJ20_06915 [Candidatus Methanoplasma sp.]|jgi:hypothetical protein|nr:hypothetical protein [Candidatus Methanoplasma sp.]